MKPRILVGCLFVFALGAAPDSEAVFKGRRTGCHGDDGKGQSAWGHYNDEEKTSNLIGICEMVASNKMPLWY